MQRGAAAVQFGLGSRPQPTGFALGVHDQVVHEPPRPTVTPSAGYPVAFPLTDTPGHRPITILKVGLSVVDVDLNHPMAGKTPRFDLEIIEVREASAEELDHGHVHGAGGVGHD